MQKSLKFFALVVALVAAPVFAANSAATPATPAAASASVTVTPTSVSATVTPAAAAAQPGFLTRGYNSTKQFVVDNYNVYVGGQSLGRKVFNIAAGSLAAYAVYRIYADCACDDEDDKA